MRVWKLATAEAANALSVSSTVYVGDKGTGANQQMRLQVQCDADPTAQAIDFALLGFATPPTIGNNFPIVSLATVTTWQHYQEAATAFTWRNFNGKHHFNFPFDPCPWVSFVIYASSGSTNVVSAWVWT